MTANERWEYMARIIKADKRNQWAEESKEFFMREYRAYGGTGEFEFAKFAPQYMMGILNKMGEQGWELVHMQPVAAGGNHDVLMHSPYKEWTHSYFCVFKRCKRD